MWDLVFNVLRFTLPSLPALEEHQIAMGWQQQMEIAHGTSSNRNEWTQPTDTTVRAGNVRLLYEMLI